MKGKQTQWQQWQIDYLTANYADTPNDEICSHIGILVRTMRRKAAELGLEKSAAYMKAAQLNTARCAAIANRGEGNHGKVNLLTYGAKYRFRKGVNCRQRLGDERERERLRKVHAKRNETIRKDYMRLRWGLEPRTKLIKHLPKNERDLR